MKYIILGAGPTGLTLGNKLKEKGISDFLILEKNSEAGGLCRSIEVDEGPFDIGGGHFLDVRRPEVNEFLFHFMPKEEWNEFIRDSRIEINGDLIHHPIEANIWQMKLEDQVNYLKSIATAGCNTGKAMPSDFVNWIYWKLGERIADDYMIPYNQKMFGKDLDKLGTYWLSKLPNVSFEETLLSCLTRKAYGEQPGHARFYYPKNYGYGELWLRMANEISDNIVYDQSVKAIDFTTKTVVTKTGDQYHAEFIITTIPWLEFENLKGMPVEIRKSIYDLKYSSIQTEYCRECLDTDAHWIYCPDKKLNYHRILVRHNFCKNSRGYWTETNSNRIIDQAKSNDKFFNQYAYPLNTISKPVIMNKLLSWSRAHQVIGLGRWGEHEHYNSDVVVERAMNLTGIL